MKISRKCIYGIMLVAVLLTTIIFGEANKGRIEVDKNSRTEFDKFSSLRSDSDDLVVTTQESKITKKSDSYSSNYEVIKKKDDTIYEKYLNRIYE
ncbi:MAG: hypothetical protein JXR69_07715 [Candidatus Delongbacteria bacterium]|nr:hypothetical protein [Candidatus Delongbacteria bacterium]